MSTSKTQQDSYDKGQSDGSKGNYDPASGGFIETILDRPMRDCDNATRDKAYEDGYANGSKGK